MSLSISLATSVRPSTSWRRTSHSTASQRGTTKATTTPAETPPSSIECRQCPASDGKFSRLVGTLCVSHAEYTHTCTCTCTMYLHVATACHTCKHACRLYLHVATTCHTCTMYLHVHVATVYRTCTFKCTHIWFHVHCIGNLSSSLCFYNVYICEY